MKYYLISGEASGDLHGAHLIKALKQKDSNAEFRVWGGDLMQAEGATVVRHIDTLAYMGFWEVLKHLPEILQNITLCKQDILAFAPDAIVYIDYPGFNLRIARWAKTKGFTNLYYISPQVWAWKEKRVLQMKRDLDALYVILPFEKPFFEDKHDFRVHFVGHPLLDYVNQHSTSSAFLEKYPFSKAKPLIALLPGSRIQEIKKILPLFVRVAKAYPELQFAIAKAPNLKEEVYFPYIKNTPITLIHNHTYDLLKHSHTALVTSGTATLETALFDVPQIVCYRSSLISYWIGKKIIRLRYISLVNLILEQPAVPELIQNNCDVNTIRIALDELMLPEKRSEMKKHYKKLKSLLGEAGASQKTAERIYNQLVSRQS
ncbi:MAG: lipid-A-disaccharide synthase [Flavobacteriia bacterium]|nr:lipid-A-disaccharide synthase [Flavobacteriia bacterium]